MTKPSSKRRPRSQGRNPAVKPVAPVAAGSQETAAEGAAPEAITEVPAVPVAEQAPVPDFDPALDGGEHADEIFGEKEPEPPATDPAPAAVVAQEQPEPATLPATSAGPEKVQLFGVDGVRHCIPLATVQFIVGEDATKRAADLRTSAVMDLQKRMRATDGRCAPVIFTQTSPDAQPYLFSGIESLAAAMALGESHVFVIVIAADDAPRVQRSLAIHLHSPIPASPA